MKRLTALVLAAGLAFGTAACDTHPGEHCVQKTLHHHSIKLGGDRWECSKWAK